jgi:hypothetical protein
MPLSSKLEEEEDAFVLEEEAEGLIQVEGDILAQVLRRKQVQRDRALVSPILVAGIVGKKVIL